MHLSDALRKFYLREGNKIVFSNKSSLNQVALQMWEQLNYAEIDNSVLSKVLSGKRLFSFKQLRVFCEILQIKTKNRQILFDALIDDKLGDMSFNNIEDKYKHLAKLKFKKNFEHRIQTGTEKISAKSKTILKQLKVKIIPQKNTLSKVGVKYSNEAYYYLVNKGVQENSKQTDNNFLGFNVAIPGCNFNKTVKGLINNCKCGYHLALYGVIKEGLCEKSIDRNIIQNEIKNWIAYFFQRETMITYLEKNMEIYPDYKKLLILFRN